MSKITKDDAIKITSKLQSQPKSHSPLNIEVKAGGKHDRVNVRHGTQWIGSYGVLRGSKSDASHNFIAGQLHISRDECDMLARCPLSIDDFIALMLERGVIAAE